MKLMPDFILSSATRLLLVHTLFAWLFLQASLTDLPLVPGLALMIAPGFVVEMTESWLDVHAGFELPREATLLLPMLFNEYVRESFPELGSLLGISPCWHDVVYKDKRTQCKQDLAYTCFQHAQIEDGKKSLQVMEDCYKDYGISTAKALQHQKQCHIGHDFQITGPLACIRAKTHLLNKEQISPKLFPSVECTIIYALWDLIIPMLHDAGAYVHTRGSSEFCWTKADPNDWTVSTTRSGSISRLLKHVD